MRAVTGQRAESDRARTTEHPFPNWSVFDCARRTMAKLGTGVLSTEMSETDKCTLLIKPELGTVNSAARRKPKKAVQHAAQKHNVIEFIQV